MTEKTRQGTGRTRSSSKRSVGAAKSHLAQVATSGQSEKGTHLGTHNMTFARIVDQVTEAGLTQKELSVAVGASLRTVQNWASGDAAPRGPGQQRLLELKYIVEELSIAYTDEAVEIWFRARNRNLGGRSPLELLSEGSIDDVRREAERVAGAM